ncbi:hypothetical protein TWF281_003211 [Arthrobotrys megalospora]
MDVSKFFLGQQSGSDEWNLFIANGQDRYVMYIVGVDGKVVEEGDVGFGNPSPDEYEFLDEKYMVKAKSRKKRSGRQVYEVFGKAFDEVEGFIQEEMSR